MTDIVQYLPTLSRMSCGNNNFYALMGSEFPTGSVKYISVLGMLAHLKNIDNQSRIRTVYGSTSGNTGIAAAHLCNEAGMTFVAIADHKLEQEKADKIVGYGGEIIRVAGGVHERIDLTRELAENDPWGVDLDQYSNPGALLGHYQITGPMIWSAMGKQIDAIVVAIGTGGTFGGIAAYLTQRNPKLITVPVDAKGSAVIDGVSSPRHLTGIGCAFIPANVHRAYQFIRSKPLVVNDQDAFSTARWFRDVEGFGVGGSGGAVVKAALDLAKETDHKHILMVFHDGEDAYQSTVYSDDWMVEHGFIHTIKEMNYV